MDYDNPEQNAECIDGIRSILGYLYVGCHVRGRLRIAKRSTGRRGRIRGKFGLFFSNVTTEAYKGFRKGRYWNLRNNDMDMLAAQVPEIKYISPILFGGRSDNNTVRGDKYGTYYIKGLNPMYNFIEPQSMIYGRYLNEVDIRDKRKVCVIGKKCTMKCFRAPVILWDIY